MSVWPYGPLIRYVKLGVMLGTFSLPPTSKETASYWSQHASWHVHDAHAVVHVGIDHPQCGKENIPGIPGICATRSFIYLARGPRQDDEIPLNLNYVSLKQTNSSFAGNHVVLLIYDVGRNSYLQCLPSTSIELYLWWQNPNMKSFVLF